MPKRIEEKLMTEMGSKGQSVLDPRVRDEQIGALAADLARPFTADSIKSWLQVSKARERFFKDFYWCSLRWPRSIGRSAGASLVDGFSISAQFRAYDYSSAGGGSYPREESWRDLPAPLRWEADDDAEHYRVNLAGTYVEFGAHVDANRIGVQISGTWTNPTHIARFLLPNPLGHYFGSFDGAPIVLDTIDIEQHLIKPVHPWSVRM
jgi:hypothetical protein